MKKSIMAAFIAAAVGILTHPTQAALPSYKVEVLGADLQGFGMNERGDVVGRKLLSGNLGVAFVARRGEPVTLLPVPAEWLGSDAYAINESGVIVGAVSLVGVASIGSRAAAWWPTESGYEFQLLGALPGHVHSTALAVNDLGDIVGGSGGIGLGMYSSAALFTGSSVVELPGLSLAADVNNQRTVVSGNTLLDLDSMVTTTIPLPPGNWQGVVTNDLNNVGAFCGHILGFSGCSTFPLKWTPGAGWTILGGCATTTSAVSLNDRGDAITFVYQGGLGVVFADAGYTNVGTLIAPGQGNWLVTGLAVINNARQILGSAKNLPNTTAQLVRLVPIGAADLNGDGHVDGADLALLLGSWGPCLECPADLNGDGLVGGEDIALLLGEWGN
ncbi:MAG: hypothetical protein KF724_01550 [Phycisphaeraceae bacterium]|nr:hypothetical protein [Phycisphaeraceae bacterium]